MFIRNWKLFKEGIERNIEANDFSGKSLLKLLDGIIPYHSSYSTLEKPVRGMKGDNIKIPIEVTDSYENEITCKTYEGFVNTVNNILLHEGWTIELIKSAVTEITTQSYSAEMDLFLYHYDKSVALGGFTYYEDVEPEHELIMKIGYGYHRTQYGRLRHQQNFKGREDRLFNLLFNITFQVIFFGFLDDDKSHVKNTQLANEMNRLLTPEYLTSMKLDPISSGTNLLPMLLKWDLVEVKESNNEGAMIEFKIVDLYNSKFTEDLSMSLKDFSDEIHRGILQLNNTYEVIRGFDIPHSSTEPIIIKFTYFL